MDGERRTIRHQIGLWNCKEVSLRIGIPHCTMTYAVRHGNVFPPVHCFGVGPRRYYTTAEIEQLRGLIGRKKK